MRLGLVSDVHWPADAGAVASWHNAFDFAGLSDRVERARRLFAGEGVDAVVVAGDVCHDGDPASARTVLDRLGAEATTPLLVVAGNHDLLRSDRLLRELVEPPAVLLDGDLHEIAGWRLRGVSVARDAGTGRTRWEDRSSDPGGADVLVSHFPVLSRAARLAERGLAYPGDLLGRAALTRRVHACGTPTVVLSGHIHVRESHAVEGVLQLSAGAFVEAPFDAAIVDLERDAGTVRVRRRAVRLGPPAGERDPVLAPEDETWSFRDGGWREQVA